MNRSKQVLMVVVLLLTSAGAPAAFAQQMAPVSGTWNGTLSSPAKEKVAVDATFDARSVSLHFDEPYNCRIAANVLDTEDTGTRYRFKSSQNGGAFCDRLYPGDVVVVTSPKKVTVTIEIKKAIAWSGDLSGPASSP